MLNLILSGSALVKQAALNKEIGIWTPGEATMRERIVAIELATGVQLNDILANMAALQAQGLSLADAAAAMAVNTNQIGLNKAISDSALTSLDARVSAVEAAAGPGGGSLSVTSGSFNCAGWSPYYEGSDDTQKIESFQPTKVGGQWSANCIVTIAGVMTIRNKAMSGGSLCYNEVPVSYTWYQQNAGACPVKMYVAYSPLYHAVGQTAVVSASLNGVQSTINWVEQSLA